MPTTPIFVVIALGGASLYWGATALWQGAKKIEHRMEQTAPKIAHAFKHGLRKHAEPKKK